MWWLQGRLVEERERARHEAVLQLGNEAEVYAEIILSVCRAYTEFQLEGRNRQATASPRCDGIKHWLLLMCRLLAIEVARSLLNLNAQPVREKCVLRYRSASGKPMVV